MMPRMSLVVLVYYILATSCTATTSSMKEVIVGLPEGGSVALSTRGPSAFRVRFLPRGVAEDPLAQVPGPVDAPLVAPDEADAPFSKVSWHSLGEDTVCRVNREDTSSDGQGTALNKTADTLDTCKSLCEQASDCVGVEWGIVERRCEFWTTAIGATVHLAQHSCLNFTRKATDARGISVVGIGSLSVTSSGRLVLRGASGELLTESEPVGAVGPPPQAPARTQHPGGWFQGTPAESGDEKVWAGETIFLRAPSGKYLEAEELEVQARFDTPSVWQGFVVESRSGDGIIHHGDTIFLHTHLGTAIDAHDGQVLARWDAQGQWQELLVERKYGWGAVKEGDAISLKTTEGKYIVVQDISVEAHWSPHGDSKFLTVSKAPSTRPLRSGDGIFLHDGDGKMLEVEGEQVLAREATHAVPQRWLIEKNDAEAGSQIFSGDTVSLVAFTGLLMDIEQDLVQARFDERGEWQELVIDRDLGDGPIADGEVVFLRAHTNAYINVANESVQARWADRGRGQSLRLETRLGKCTQTVALNGSAAASSWEPDRQPWKAADGDVRTSWSSRAVKGTLPATAPSTDGEWLSIDLGAVHNFSRVEIRWEKEFAASYFVQGMVEGHQWATFALALGREGWVVTLLPHGSRARWVRLRVLKPSTYPSYSVAEFVVHACHATLAFSSRGGRLYGRGASPYDAHSLTALAVQPQVSNLATFVPYYYSADGYGAMGVVGHRENMYYGHIYPVSYALDRHQLFWGYTGAFELYLMPAATLEIGTKAYFALTGVPRVPPLYAFGFMASRWGWKDHKYIQDTLDKFRSGNFPLDSIVLDCDWFANGSDYGFPPHGKKAYQDFALNKDMLSAPDERLQVYREDKHVRVGSIRKPRLGNTDFLAMARSKGWILARGTPGGAYPMDLETRFAFGRALNFSKLEVREWYSQQLLSLLAAGIDFWWNDEGEADYLTYHWWNVAESNALTLSNATDPRKRFYSLNRAFSPGLARLGATVWTGDVNPSWEDLGRTPGMMLNWGLAGAPYVACDIGGFAGETQPELLARWMQVGVFMPAMRVHSWLWASPHWPWLFGEEASAVIREALDLRYRLIPYHYSLAHAMFSSRTLWMRPLVMDFPGDRVAATLTTQWMDGRILVAPVLRQDSHRQVYLPEGTWYHFNTSHTVDGPVHLGGKVPLGEVPVFVRPGTVLPLGPVVQSTDMFPGGSLEVQIYKGADGVFELVEDDGETVAYEVGRVRATSFRWYDAAGTLSWRARGAATEPGDRAFIWLSVTIFEGSTHRVLHLPRQKLLDGGSISEGLSRLS